MKLSFTYIRSPRSNCKARALRSTCGAAKALLACFMPVSGRREGKDSSTHGVAAARSPLPWAVFQKWELPDHLMTDEIVNGPFTVKDALIALASIKADILRFGLGDPE
jgi:hypothetical protein